MSKSHDDYMEQMRGPKKKNPLQAFLPVLGLLLLLLAGAIGFFASGPVYHILNTNTSLFAQVSAPQQQMELVVGIVIGLLVVMIVSAIYAAAFAPKPSKLVSEKQMMKERQDKEAERLAKKRRQQQMRAKMKQRNKN